MWDRSPFSSSLPYPYWNEELQDLWDKACKAEKEWTSCKTNAKSTLRSTYVQRRKNFDTFNRKSKRRYQIEQQNQLHYLEGHNTKDFWKSIGKLGLANERKTQRIYQVRTENGEVTNDTDTVLERWKTEYESAFNSVDSCNNYDDTFLADIKNRVRNENNYRNDIDVSGLNREISREEVKDAVYKAKLEKNNYGQWENPEQLTKKNIDPPNCRQHHFPTKQFNSSK
ncbi:unnamed protein product [Mytilus edulis]|uniref:Uncharacterized protein n=1 Tax=Mytilus edulis TaxID=6550 RepID=A0A8S3PVV4_MYTED|nr:unnamed protein product [Mytilus edulis]